MLAYAAAGASDDPRLAAAVADVVERLVPLCRSRRALADAALNPQRAFKYAIPHRLITALGRPYDLFDRFILAQCRTARSQAGELPPVAELEREWVMGGWRQATGRPADPFDVRGTALARPVNLLTASREADIYAVRFVHKVPLLQRVGLVAASSVDKVLQVLVLVLGVVMLAFVY